MVQALVVVWHCVHRRILLGIVVVDLFRTFNVLHTAPVSGGLTFYKGVFNSTNIHHTTSDRTRCF